MNAVSSNYKNLINTSLSLTPRFKIVIDDVEYLSNVIKSYPKISHSNTRFIGGFPAKTLDMEIYDLENNLNLENKEIVVYKGFVINDTIEYIKQGVFIAKSDKITTKISSKTISLSNVQDRTQLLDDKYESSLDWSVNHTGLEIVQEICTKKGITLASDTFNFANYSFKQPNFPENTTNREVISRIAEIGGEIAIFNCEGELVIKGQHATGDVIQKHRYEKLSKENAFVVNTVVLGKDGIDDDIVYPETIETDRVEFKILDNPFVDLYRQEMIEEVSKHILGMSYVPYKVENMLDGFIYELNDVVSIIDKNGDIFDAVILDISNNSRIKSTIKADVNKDSKTNYKLAGSNKQSINDIKFEVDHINKQINATAAKVTENEKEVANLKIETGKISTEVSKKVDDKDVVSTINQSAEQIDLKGNRIVIESDNFNLTEDGTVKATAGEIAGFNISSEGFYYLLQPKKDYKDADFTKLNNYIIGDGTLTDNEKYLYDMNNDNVLDVHDLIIMDWTIINKISKSSPGKFQIKIPEKGKNPFLIEFGLYNGLGEMIHGFEYDKSTLENLNVIGELQLNGKKIQDTIVESGSNTNGSWTKYSDGTMICSGKIDGVSSLYDYWGQFKRTEEDIEIYFPATFKSGPYVTANGTNASGIFAALIGGTYTTHFKFTGLKANNNNSTSYGIYYQATGKWK